MNAKSPASTATVTVRAATYARITEFVTLCQSVLTDPDAKDAGASRIVDVHEPPRKRLRREADALDRQKRAYDLSHALMDVLRDEAPE